MSVFLPDSVNGYFDELSNKKSVKMMSVPTGCFFKSLGRLYLKVAQRPDGLHFKDNKELFNCFNVSEGYLDFIDLTKPVYPVDVEILTNEAKGDN